jgi:plastocyanin
MHLDKCRILSNYLIKRRSVMNKKIGGGFSLGVLLSIICLALAGCGGGSSGGDNAVTSSVEVVDCSTVISATTVTATSTNTFNPQNAPPISVNGVVRWISASNLAHTVTSGTSPTTADGKFDQPLNNNGSSVCLKFTTAGTYNYYCTFHYAMGMTGVVTVQ